eukprot:6037163-Amphidinium_carterae.1
MLEALRRASYERTSKAARLRLSQSASSMKKIWHAAQALIEESGQPAMNEASRVDADLLVSEALDSAASVESAMFFRAAEEIVAKKRARWFDMLSPLRSYTVLPIGAWSESDLIDAIQATSDKCPREEDSRLDQIEREYLLLLSIKMQARFKASYRATGRTLKKP